ncbi:MAG: hypothetical protein AB7T31_02990 [Gemmatimonadales bacterium]
MSGRGGTVRVMLVFADHGAFHREHVEIPLASLERHDRLVDCLREDPDVLERIHVDPARLCAAFIMEHG